MKEFSHSPNSPTCESLPPSSDDPSCVKIDQYRNSKTKTDQEMTPFFLLSLVSSSTNIPSILQRLLSSMNPLLIVLISICLPVVLICLFVLIVFCCCRNENTRKTSSHVLLSPFHSTIHQNIVSSSSSSTNTNYRQIGLQTESKYLGHLLSEIPFANIRFLQEIGEGKNEMDFSIDNFFFFSGEFGRIYIGELMDCTTKCLIKTFENEKMKQDYSREIESMRN